MSNPRDKYASRFDNEESEESDENAQPEQNEVREESEGNAQNEMNGMNPWDADNVKTSWNGMTAYLPDEMKQRVDDEYDRVKYVADVDLTKDRHYKPLLFELALEQLDDMDSDEITERIDRMEREGVKER